MKTRKCFAILAAAVLLSPLASCVKDQPEVFDKPSSARMQSYLENVRDPGNLGTLLRSALAFHFYDVVLSKGCAEVYSPKVLMASQGAIFYLNIRQSENASSLDDLKELKTKGYHILGTDLASSSPLKSLQIPSKIALLLGNEGKGLSKEAIGFADQNVRIEMDGIDSLNVGVAGGIIMYEVSVK